MPYKLLFGLYGIVDVSAYELSTFVPTTTTIQYPGDAAKAAVFRLLATI